MAEAVNPYQSPQTLDCSTVAGEQCYEPTPRRRRLAAHLLGTSAALALGYTYIDEVVLRTSFGTWPTLIGTSILAIVAAVLTRDVLLAPLCCFGATMAADFLAAVVRSVAYAQIPICLKLALAFSLPALVIALVLRRRADVSLARAA